MWRTWRCFHVLQLRSALILRELNQIFIACLFKGSQEQSFFLQTLLFTAFLVTVLKNLTYALVSTWSLVSSRWEHVKRKMHPWFSTAWFLCKYPVATSFWKYFGVLKILLQILSVQRKLLILWRFQASSNFACYQFTVKCRFIFCKYSHCSLSRD